MKISEETMQILKNYATINQSIQFNTGNVLKTVAPQKNILAEAEVEENFPKSFCIYELNRFLGIASLLENPDYEFEDTKLTIKSGTKTRVSYTYADPSMVVVPPPNTIEVPNPEIEFNLRKVDLESSIKAAMVLQEPEIAIVGDTKNIKLVALDTKNPQSDLYSIDVGETTAEYKMIFKLENLRMIVESYEVKISSKGIAHFFNEKRKLSYWIATEQASTYNG
jgi:hypothetical protein|tara:strand:+ start:1728 stop:2396 length:669 start_codon:yes stop_codon:yes gene_type:complete